jgi:hypothetical protein
MDRSVDKTVSWENTHLRTRCQQRGILKRDLQTLLDAADHFVPVGRGCLAITLSRRAAIALRSEGIAGADLDRAQRRAMVIDGDGSPITLLIPSGRQGRRYRHGRTGRSWA